MTSERQIEANRRNARRSTGPKTPRGRYLARMNARKHGLRGHEVLLPDEDPAEYKRYRGDIFRDLQPVGFLESQLADHVVYDCWRLRRCERIEAGLLGGGTHVMDLIASRTLEEFSEMLEPKENLEDMSPTQLLAEQLLLDMQLYQLKTQEIAKNPYKYNPHADEDTPFDQKTVDLYLDVRESELQHNPLTYDIALAFQKNLMQQGALANLARYETTHRRALQRSLQDLHRVQDRRQKNSRSQSNVIDVGLSSSGE